MSTKKTSGFVNIEDYNFVQCSPEEVKDWAGRGTFKAATLVIGEGDTPPKVFTEEEVKAAIEAEPELPGDMPDEMWEACKSDRDTMQEAMRIVVRLTKEGIAKELNITL